MRSNNESIIDRLKYFQKKSGFRSGNILVEKDWSSADYWRYRINRPIIKIKYNLFRFLRKPAPWIAPAATLFLEEWLSNEKCMAEFGSGKSTAFFAKKVKLIVSIEHFEVWYEKVNQIFKEQGLSNIDYRFIPESEKHDHDLQELDQLISTYNSNFEIKSSYADYFLALRDLPDEYFDIILVDGRARPECVFSSLSKLKKGGLMVLDNSERRRYEVAFKHLQSWESFTVSNGLTDTTFWIKPN